MSASETAALVVALAAAVLVAALLFVVNALTRTLASLRTTVDELRRETRPLLSDLREVVETAGAEAKRVDSVLETAESITGTVDAASRLAYLAFSNPMIKILAFGSGTARAARRFRKARGED